MAIKLNKEGEFVFETVDEAVEFDARRRGMVEANIDVKVTHVTEASTPEVPPKHGEAFDSRELDFIKDFVERHTVGDRLKKGKLGELAETLGRSKDSIKDVVKRMKKSLVVSKGIVPRSRAGRPAGSKKKVTKTRKPRKKVNHFKYWTKEADDQLIEERKKYLLATGKLASGSVKKISKAIGRTVHAIHMRMHDLKKAGKM